MKPLSILYVEDDYGIRVQITELLEFNHHNVWACETAEAALALFAERPFDVLITDVSLPGLSGMELARRVLATNADYGVVLCSGYELGHGLVELGPNVRLLLKPFDISQLETLLTQMAVRQ